MQKVSCPSTVHREIAGNNEHTIIMNQQEIIESNSFNSGFGSSFNSIQSESDKAWCYANHVVKGKQSQRNPLLNDDDGWFTCSEHSDCDDEGEIQTDDDESNGTYNEGGEFVGDDDEKRVTESKSNRQTRVFRPRFQRQASIASISSANEKKERTTRTSKSPAKRREDNRCTNKCETDQEKRTTASEVLIPEVVVRHEPDKDERRKIRRLELARMKSEEMWGSLLESDSDSEQSHKTKSTSLNKPKPLLSSRERKFRKKSYSSSFNETSPISNPSHRKNHFREVLPDVDSESERSCSPSKSMQDMMVDKSSIQSRELKKKQIVKQQELYVSESERQSSSPKPSDHSVNQCRQNPNVSESRRANSVPKILKQSNVNSSDATHTVSKRGRSASPMNTNADSKEGDQPDSKPKTKVTSKEKKYNKYEIVPTSGSFRQNRLSINAPSNDHPNYSTERNSIEKNIGNSTHNKVPTSSQRIYQNEHRQSPLMGDKTANVSISTSKHTSMGSEKKVATLNRVPSLDRSKHNCGKVPDCIIKGDSMQGTNPKWPANVRCLTGQSSFSEKKIAPRILEESLRSSTCYKDKGAQDRESTIPKYEKVRHANTPPVPNRENSSHSARSSSSTTLPSPVSTKSSSSGSVPSYKNTVQVKNKDDGNKKYPTNKMKEKKNIEGDTTTHALDDIMKSRRFRDSNLDLQKKTKQYLVAVNGSKAKTSTTWR